MDTKWKNNIKLLLWVLLLVFGLNSVISSIIAAPEYLRKNYFKTASFDDELNGYLESVKRYDLGYISKDEVKKQLTVSPDEINEHRYRFGNLEDQINSIKEQYQEKIDAAKSSGNTEVVNFYQSELDLKIKDITENFTSDEHVKKKVLAEKEQEIDETYSSLEEDRGNFLRGEQTFQYYFKNKETGRIITNTANLSEKNLIFNRSYPNLDVYSETAGKSMLFEGWVGVPKSSSTTSYIIENYNSYGKQQLKYLIYLGAGLLSLLAAIVMYKRKQIHFPSASEKWKVLYNKIPIEARLALFILTAFMSYESLTLSSFLVIQSSVDNLHYLFDSVVSGCIWGILLIVQWSWLKDLISNPETLKEEINAGVLPSIVEVTKSAFTNRKIGTKIFIILVVTFLFGMGIMTGFVDGVLFAFYLLALVVIGIPLYLYIMKKTGYYNQILNASNAFANGHVNFDLPEKKNSSLGVIAHNLNTLKEGVQISQKEQIKSERLKTELITNVSHDLRTPLTSIITYTDLLKNPNLTPEEHDSYVEILDRKAKRLKVMIDDLFEATKMASGNMELEITKVDLVQLLQQALAEYDEQIEASSLHFRVSQSNHPIYANVDGRKMWRAFENLIGNILKYSLENTRVYISITEEQNQIQITFKNVSKFELGESTDELFERFKRGDTSRNTEGSGLGLAIAKSIVDLHEGDLQLELDGDLFKATITLNKI